MTGVDALHQGVELEVTVKPVRNLELTGMLSLADWRWNAGLPVIYIMTREYL